MEFYYYGMRLRGFAPGCQPKDGFVECMSDKDKKVIKNLIAGYHDVLVYNRKLTEKEVEDYELDPFLYFNKDRWVMWSIS